MPCCRSRFEEFRKLDCIHWTVEKRKRKRTKWVQRKRVGGAEQRSVSSCRSFFLLDFGGKWAERMGILACQMKGNKPYIVIFQMPPIMSNILVNRLKLVHYYYYYYYEKKCI